MSKDNIIILAGLGIAAIVLLPKLRGKTTVVQAAPQTQNVNNEMWTKLLGGAWSQLLAANGNSSGGGTPFIVKNPFTGLFSTSDGKPLYTGDGATDYMISNLGMYGNAQDYTTTTGNVADDTATNNFMASLGF